MFTRDIAQLIKCLARAQLCFTPEVPGCCDIPGDRPTAHVPARLPPRTRTGYGCTREEQDLEAAGKGTFRGCVSFCRTNQASAEVSPCTCPGTLVSTSALHHKATPGGSSTSPCPPSPTKELVPKPPVIFILCPSLPGEGAGGPGCSAGGDSTSWAPTAPPLGSEGRSQKAHLLLFWPDKLISAGQGIGNAVILDVPLNSSKAPLKSSAMASLFFPGKSAHPCTEGEATTTSSHCPGRAIWGWRWECGIGTMAQGAARNK